MSKQDDAAVAFVSVASGEMPEDTNLGPLTRELTRVEQANQLFYDAYRERDINAMAKVWLHSPHARCIHPSWELVVGWKDIRESWVELFRSIEHADFQLEDVHIEIAGRIAWVNQLAYATLHTDDGEVISASAITTNLFELSEGSWRLTLHHSSSFIDDELDENEDPLDLDPDRPPQGGSGMTGLN